MSPTVSSLKMVYIREARWGWIKVRRDCDTNPMGLAYLATTGTQVL